MASTTEKLTKKGHIHPPSWLPTNVMYEVITGSVAYGVSSDTSDMDVCGFGIPKKEIIFPHLAGEILDFGRQKKRFGQFQKHGVWVEDAMGGKGRTYDITIYNIVKFFRLNMECNPNMVDTLFVPQECVLHNTQVGNMVREQRKLFLSKKCWHTFKGYAYSQLSQSDKAKKSEEVLAIRDFEEQHGIPHETSFAEVEQEVAQAGRRGELPSKLDSLDDGELFEYHQLFQAGMEKSKRTEMRKRYNMDVKFLYHIVRLLDECEQLLTYGDMDLRRAKEHMKAVRKGEVPETEVRKWFNVKEKELEVLYNKEPSPIPHKPDEGRIKNLLLQCLEHHYGSMDDCVVNPDAATAALKEINEVLAKHQNLL
jgi:predicted nucleotidyltransferase